MNSACFWSGLRAALLSAWTASAGFGCAASAPPTSPRLPPPCGAGRESRDFPEETADAVYRAIVRLRIGSDGRPTEMCVLRVEGDAQFADAAFGDVEKWTFPKERAGEERERIVTYRLRPRAEP